MDKKICKFDVTDMLPIGITFVVLGIGVAYGLNVMGDVKEDNCDGTGESYFNDNCNFCPTGFNFNGTTNCINATAGDDNITAILQGGQQHYNATNSAMTGVSKLPEKLPLIATVVVAAIIIGILVRYMLLRFG